ncbi:legumain-like [Lycorma delicatula]|uniref:legumain-like n=1 Tax=Lycorma delicatula TaxID=130591 RepID=UPI003F50D4F6
MRKQNVRVNPPGNGQSQNIELGGSTKIRIESYLPITDQLIVSLDQRIGACEEVEILASTAAATDELAWACYCDYKNYPCLGDLYSINWMEHLDSKIPETENLYDQYQKIRTLTKASHVNLYGDLITGASYTKDFFGPKNETFDDSKNTNLESIKKGSGVPSHEVALQWIKHMSQNGSNALERMRYSLMAVEIERKRELVDTTIHEILKRIAGEDKEFLDTTENKHNKLNMEMFDCYEKVYRHFSQQCFNMNKNPYVFKHFYKFANICLLGSLDYQEKTMKAVNEVCGHNFPQITDTL